MKRTYIRTLFYGGLLSLCCLGMTSCEDYLDKAPESSVNPNDAFKNFRNFQGFTEELYYCIRLCSWLLEQFFQLGGG